MIQGDIEPKIEAAFYVLDPQRYCQTKIGV